MRPYIWLLVIVVIVGAALGTMARSPRRVTRTMPEAPGIRPRSAILLEIRGRSIAPDLVRVAKGSRVALEVVNAGPDTAHLALPGYDDRVPRITLAPGGSWSGSFLADRPGDDFAWTLNGEPAARLDVEGSHLVEGHR
jgi:hypothetical protein